MDADPFLGLLGSEPYRRLPTGTEVLSYVNALQLLLLVDLLVGRLARLLFSGNHSQPAGGRRRGFGTAVIVFIDPAM